MRGKRIGRGRGDRGRIGDGKGKRQEEKIEIDRAGGREQCDKSCVYLREKREEMGPRSRPLKQKFLSGIY